MIKYVVALLAVLPAALSCSGTLPRPGDPGRSHAKLPTEDEWITQVLGSTDPNVDLIEAGTVLASGLTGTQRPYSTIPNALEVPIRKARDRIGQASSAEQKIEALNELVLPAIHAALHAELSWLRDAFAVDSGTCSVTVLLYLISADALSLPLDLVCPPGHIYLRYSGEGQRRNIEATSAGQHLTEAQYLKEIEKRLVSEIPHPEQVKDTEWYFATKSRRQFAALLLLNRGFNRGAESREKDYLNASRLAPDLPYVFRQLTGFHINSGNLELAEEFATRAVGLAGAWPKIHLLRGRIRSLRGNLKGSLEDVEAAIRYSPGNALLHHTRAALLRQLDRSREAVDACNRSLELDPDQTGARRERAYLYMTAMKDYARAVEDLSEIILKGPSEVWDYHNRGRCLAQTGEHQKGLEDMTRATQTSPENPTFWKDRAICLGLMKRHEEAIEDFGKAIALDPRNAELYTLRAKSYAHLGDEARWEADFNKAKELRAKP